MSVQLKQQQQNISPTKNSIQIGTKSKDIGVFVLLKKSLWNLFSNMTIRTIYYKKNANKKKNTFIFCVC